MSSFKPKPIQEVEAVFQLLIKMYGKNGENGSGCFTLQNRSQGGLILVERFGDPENPQEAQKQALANSERLFYNTRHVSSAQSLKDESGIGAIVAGQEFIFSFYGLTPTWANEAVVLETALRLNFINLDLARAIAAISHNQHFEPLHEFCRKNKSDS